MTTIEPATAEFTMTVLMTPDKANFSGKVHGGALLKAHPGRIRLEQG